MKRILAYFIMIIILYLYVCIHLPVILCTYFSVLHVAEFLRFISDICLINIYVNTFAASYLNTRGR